MDVEQTNILCCCLCQPSCSNNPHHCSSSLQSWDRTQRLVFNPPWSLQSCRTGFGSESLYLASRAAQNSAAFSGHLCCKHNLCGIPSSSLHSPSWQGLLLSSLWLPSKWERAACLKSCLCQALICCRLHRALYASTRLRCNESSINYCANNAPLIWMLSVLWKQQPSQALLSTSCPQTTAQTSCKSGFALGENCSVCDKASLARADTHSPTVPLSSHFCCT